MMYPRHKRLASLMAMCAAPTGIAMEDDITGKPNQEMELVFYAQLTPAYEEVLHHAVHREAHEQWELRVPKSDDNAVAGRFRVRKTSPIGMDKGEVQYVLTSKTKALNGRGEIEVGVASSPAQFEQFRAMSAQGMIKHRYEFMVHGRPDRWQVDIYHDKDGAAYPWVKMDYEVTNEDFTCPPFPAGLIDEATVIHNGMSDPGVKAKIRELYDQCFITKNQVLYAAPKEMSANPAPAYEEPPAQSAEVVDLRPEATP